MRWLVPAHSMFFPISSARPWRAASSVDRLGTVRWRPATPSGKEAGSPTGLRHVGRGLGTFSRGGGKAGGRDPFGSLLTGTPRRDLPPAHPDAPRHQPPSAHRPPALREAGWRLPQRRPPRGGGRGGQGTCKPQGCGRGERCPAPGWLPTPLCERSRSRAALSLGLPPPREQRSAISLRGLWEGRTSRWAGPFP